VDFVVPLHRQSIITARHVSTAKEETAKGDAPNGFRLPQIPDGPGDAGKIESTNKPSY
jgi:hypothetical protein